LFSSGTLEEVAVTIDATIITLGIAGSAHLPAVGYAGEMEIVPERRRHKCFKFCVALISTLSGSPA